MSRQRTIAAGCFSLTGALLMVLASRDQARAELVLRLDASAFGSLTLSADATDGDLLVGGFPLTDSRTTGLNFVDGWSQTHGATANPTFHPNFVPYPDINNLQNIYRPTYDPNGLGTGLPSVNFDVDVASGSAIDKGQMLYAGLDDLIYKNEYSMFFVAKNLDPTGGSTTGRVAFGQDTDAAGAREGWHISPRDDQARWRASVRGGGNLTSSGATAVTEAAATLAQLRVRSVIGDPLNIAFKTIDSANATTTVNSGVPVTVTGTLPGAGSATKTFSIYSGGEFSIGNVGGTVFPVTASAFKGRIGEIAIFNTKLNATDEAAVTHYLSNKWLGATAVGDEAAGAALLQQAAPTVGAPQLLRYQFWQEGQAQVAPDNNILIPEIVASGMTASNFESQTGAFVDQLTTSAISHSTNGISPSSAFLANPDLLSGPSNLRTIWHTPEEKTPADGSGPTSTSSYMAFTVTPDAGKVIDLTELAFAYERDAPFAGSNGNPTDPVALQKLKNTADSYGVWIGAPGGPFTKVGGQVGIDGPNGAPAIENGLFDTFKVDLTGVADLTAATEIRIYMWHDGPQILDADYNQDGQVDAADYVLWRNAGPTDTLANDPTPGVVDGTDYDFWRARYGNTVFTNHLLIPPSPTLVNAIGAARVDNVRLRGNVLNAGSGSALSAGVPEPTSIVSLLLGGLLALSRCGRSHRRNAP